MTSQRDTGYWDHDDYTSTPDAAMQSAAAHDLEGRDHAVRLVAEMQAAGREEQRLAEKEAGARRWRR